VNTVRYYSDLINTLTGDYDGDKVECIWQPEIVEAFCNADPKFADEPAGLMASFKRENETVAHFLKRVPEKMPQQDRMHEYQSILMAPLLNNFVVGMYSMMHDNSMYVRGYDHPDTIRLAYM